MVRELHEWYGADPTHASSTSTLYPVVRGGEREFDRY